MTFDSALLVVSWAGALVVSVAAAAIVLFWSTAAFERWLGEAGSRDSGPVEPSRT
jgi:hypothetical protein